MKNRCDMRCDKLCDRLCDRGNPCRRLSQAARQYGIYYCTTPWYQGYGYFTPPKQSPRPGTCVGRSTTLILQLVGAHAYSLIIGRATCTVSVLLSPVHRRCGESFLRIQLPIIIQAWPSEESDMTMCRST